MGRARGYKKEVTLHDIAKKAGVSISTVSRVLNKPRLVDEKTRSAVSKVLSETGYLQTMKDARKTKAETVGSKKPLGMVALMVPDVVNPHFQELIQLVEKRLTAAGYLMTLCIFDNEAEVINKYFKDLITRGFDGCIMGCLRPAEDSTWCKKFLETVPIVSIQSDIEGVDSIMTTDGEGTYEMLEHLIGLGHKKIGFIGYSWNLSLFERRLQAYTDIHKKYGLPLREEYIGRCNVDLRSGYEQACRMLSLPERPTAIHCFNTCVAMGVYIAIRDNRLRIPEDISLSAFDEAPITEVFTPPLTVVAQPLDSIATTAVNLLLERLKNGPSSPIQTVTFPTTMLLRKSVGPCNEDND